MDDQNEYEAFLRLNGGRLPGEELSPDSGLGYALQLGKERAVVAEQRSSRDNRPARLRVDLLRNPLLNAAATPLPSSYALSVYWPLILTMQGVAAAIWAHQHTAPWIGETRFLLPGPDFQAPHPDGFDLYLALLNQTTLAPNAFRSGVRISHIDAVAAAGDTRWELFLATTKASIEFVWNHEAAHVLYGHTDLVAMQFGIKTLYENDGPRRNTLPAALSQFMEYVADMDGAMNLFAGYYGRILDDDRPIDTTHAHICAAAALGILIAIYVLHQETVFQGHGDRTDGSHPPLVHRAAWILGAEAHAVAALQAQRGLTDMFHENVALVRRTTADLLRSVARNHHSLHAWIGRVDDDAERHMNQYVAELHAQSAPYHQALTALQRVS